MTRYQFIEKELRQIYGGYIPDDSEITFELVNKWIQEAFGIAAKQCYKESAQIEAVGYLNNSFYTTFKGISVVQDEQFLWKVTLPQIPVGIGYNEGISTMVFKDSTNQVSLPVVWLSENQKTYIHTMRRIPNKVLAYPEGIYVYALSTLILSQYTVSVTMVSGGDSTDLNSVFNLPDDYYPVVSEYIKAQLGFERAQPKDQANDGSDNK